MYHIVCQSLLDCLTLSHLDGNMLLQSDVYWIKLANKPQSGNMNMSADVICEYLIIRIYFFGINFASFLEGKTFDINC